MATVTVDWAAVEAAYITSDKSYKTLAKELGVSATQCAIRGKDGEWPRKRVEYRRDNARKAIARQARKDVNKLAKLMEATDYMTDLIVKIRQDPQQFNRHLVSVSDGIGGVETVEKIFDKKDTRAIRDIVGAMRDLDIITHRLYCIPTQAEAEAQRVAAERLKLEQAKAQREEQDSGAEYVFVLSDEAAKYGK